MSAAVVDATQADEHVDVDEVLAFLRLVTPAGVHMNVVAIHPTIPKRIRARAFTRETVADVEPFIRAHAEWNQYWSVNPLKTALSKKAKKENVLGMRWAHLDRDDPADSARAIIESMDPPPTIVLFSGGGWQAFWLLRDTTPIVGYVAADEQSGNVPELEETNCGVLIAAGEPDDSTRNIDRIMRLPGTTNWPNEAKLKRNPDRQPVRTRLVSVHMDRVYDLTELPRAKPKPKDRADSATAADEGKKKEDRSRTLFNAIRDDIFAGASDEDVYADYADDPHVLSQDPSRRKGTIARCIKKARAAMARNEAAVAELNERHAVVWVGNHLYVMWRDQWNGLMPRLAGKADMRAYYSNAGEAGNPFDLWMRARQRAETTIVFEPGVPVTPGTFNVWRGFGVQAHQGDCSLFLDMVKHVICSGDLELYRYVIAWCADAVQNPANRPGVVLVLKGAQGTGKGTFAHAIGHLFGHHYVYANRSRHVTGNFNAHVANKLLMFADEAVFAGDKANEGALKSMITEPQLPVELKGKDVIYTRNHLRIIMASNQDWVVPAAIGDRRFAIIEVSAIRMQDSRYFRAVNEQLDAGGHAALLHHLLTFDLTGIEIRDLPKTDARLHQQLLSLGPVEKWWYARLQAGAPTSDRDEWMREIGKAEVFEDYILESGTAGSRHRGTMTEFGMALHKLVPALGSGRTGGVAGVRVHTYKLPPLAECRADFCKRLGREVPWPAETEPGAADRPRREGREM